MQWFRIFLDIALWRRGPQDLPASTTLMWLVVSIYAVVSVCQLVLMGWDLRFVLPLVALDVALQALWLWGLLKFFGKSPRFLQTITAFIGVYALLTLLDIAVMSLMQAMGMSKAGTGPWPILHLSLILLGLGRILQQALERSLFMSMTVTLVVLLTITVTARGLLPAT